MCHTKSIPLFASMSAVRSAQHGRPVVVTLQNKDSKESGMPFHLATETTEELFEWYQVAWDITQREGTREFEVTIITLSHHTCRITPVVKIQVRIKTFDCNLTSIFCLQQKEQEKVEIRDEVAKEMSDLVVYCQPRSKDKDRFGTVFSFI